jgi:hypothetical protein
MAPFGRTDVSERLPDRSEESRWIVDGAACIERRNRSCFDERFQRLRRLERVLHREFAVPDRRICFLNVGNEKAIAKD